MEPGFCAKLARAPIPCVSEKKSAKHFSAEAAMLFSKRSMAKDSLCRGNLEAGRWYLLVKTPET
jgi:hypothetical protein